MNDKSEILTDTATMSEKMKRVKNIFLDALETAAENRETFIRDSCGNDTDMKSEVENLLKAHFEAEDFIENPVAEISSLFQTNGSRTIPKRFGNYKIIRQIGAGGMGAVFLAERDDGEFTQRAAIKIVRQTIAENEIINRFRRERQILANLNHPNIARLIDGGVSEAGEPFLAMEYIEGVPVTEFADEQNLNVEQRLRLFLKICAALSYAHRNLTIHRDIKPSNILVTKDGEPKLLDFGLAKLLDEGLNFEPAQMQTAFHAFTPAYASPEQIQRKNISTASDIYSLGAVLFELLTGCLPFPFENKELQEIARMIEKDEPLRPSMAAGSKIQTSAAKPEIKETRAKLLRGDLDNIILKALRKEPERRYKSVEAFADDIERHLTGQPITARPQTLKYHASKFIQRNKIAAVAAVLIFLTLVSGIAATAWQARQAWQEKEKAETVNSFLAKMLNYTNPVIMGSAKKTHETTITEMLDEVSRRLDSNEFTNQPEIKAELKKIIADSYNAQGRYDIAFKHYEDYIALMREIYGENHYKTLEAMGVWAAVLFARKDFTEAEKVFRQILPVIRTERENGNIKAEVMANTLNQFGYLRRTQGDSGEAEQLFRETLTLSEQIPDESYFHIGLTRSTLASTLADQGRFDEALQTSREAVEDYRRRGLDGTPDFGFVLTVYGGFLSEKGDFANADAYLHKAETIFRERLYPTHLWLGDNLRNQGISLYLQNNFVEARKKIDEAKRIYLESFGKHYDHYPTVLMIEGLIAAKTGQAAEGARLLREAVNLRVETLPKEHYWTALAKGALGECLAIQNRFAEAESLLLESYESLKNSQGLNNPRTDAARLRLSSFYKNAGKSDLINRY